ncbi:MAG: hypothetical protein ACPGXL_06965 [Chitinophagales bacterium]
MNSTLSFEQYPVWYIAFCLGLGLLYAIVLYFRDNTFKDASKRQKWWLVPASIFRWFSVSTIAFLLLSPILKTLFREVIPAPIAIIQDNSESVLNGFEQAADTTAYVAQMRALETGLADKYDVQTFQFGENVDSELSFYFDQKITNISKTLDEVFNIYDNQNIGAIVLATDGIFNQGRNPIYGSTRLDVPIYCIALGDTTPQRDLKIDKVLHNRIAYLDNKFTLRVDFSANNCVGETTVLNVYKGTGTDNKLFSKSVKIDKTSFLQSEEIILDANTPGVNQYSVRLTSVKEEITTQNNRQDVFIEVLDARQKILLLAASPHPDVSAIRQSLEENENYEVTATFVNDFKQTVKDFDLAVLHGLPSKTNGADNIIQQLKDNKIPIWFILSEQTSITAFNKVQKVVKVSGAGKGTNDVKADAVSGFNLFTIEGTILQNLEELPPLIAPFGEFSAAPTTQTLLNQKIGTVETSYPLLSIEQATGDKMAVLCGEGIWRWRLHDFKKNQNHFTFNELTSKIIQYLSVKNDKRKFRVNQPKNLFNETEKITFDAELYNDSYELINEPEVNMSIFDGAGKSFPFVFNKTGNAYSLNTGFFPAGRYTYNAKTAFNGQEYTASGSFSVAPIQLESLVTTANHQLLFNLSKRYGGEVVYPNNIDSLTQRLLSAQFQATSYSTYKTKSIINLKWLFYILLTLLSLEWFLRKYLGSY